MSRIQLTPIPIVDDPLALVGNTPIVRLKLAEKFSLPGIELLAKLEFLNPVSGSIKDRVAYRLIQDAEKAHNLGQDTTLLVPTSGNLGISIALMANKKGYRTIVFVPERTTVDRIRMLQSMGVDIVRTPSEVHPGASESSFKLAEKLLSEIPNSIIINEFTSQSNVQVHYEETAEEIFAQVGGKLDVLVVAVESGGTITGLAKKLKSKIPNLKVVAVEPEYSRIEEGKSANLSTLKSWKVEDIGNNFTPSILDKSLIDIWFKVSDKDSFATARRLIGEGVLAGPSSGSVVSAAISYAETIIKEQREARILTILNDTARNYGSTLLSDDWLLENDLMEESIMKKLEYNRIEKYRGASVEDLQLPAAVTILPNAKISQALDIMLSRDFSQIPVIDSHKKLLGYVSLSSLQAHLDAVHAQPDDPVSDWMFSFGKGEGRRAPYQIITPDTPLSELAKFFENHSFAVVTDSERKFCLGVVTKYDLYKRWRV
ncbi:hypothetical protein G9A89_022860 [Geosiphon pyriformis]|nr:hypothetical protein G9A89_022860 [Geosiphon pyriformis]